MRGDDPQVNNIFSRVFSYTPREGRTALEDFCTESLAWCLLKSSPFRTRFLQLVKKNVRNNGDILDANAEIHVYTQLEFDEAKKGRFDLVLRSIPLKDFVIVVESKVDSDFGKTQISDYRHELDHGDEFKDTKAKFFVTLTKCNTVPKSDEKHLDASLLWEDVQKILGENNTGQAVPNAPAKVQFVSVQFSEFLRTKGMHHMQLPRTNKQSFSNGVIFCHAIHEILRDVKRDSKELRKLFKGPAQPQWNDKDGQLYIELICRRPEYFSFGFVFLPKYQMYVEANWLKKPITLKEIRYLTKEHPNMVSTTWKTGFGIYGKLTKDLQGNASGIRKWFKEAVDLVLKIRKGMPK